MALASRLATLAMLSISLVECFKVGNMRQRRRLVFGSQSTPSCCASTSSAEVGTITWASQYLSKKDAADVIENILFPSNERSDRMVASGKAQGVTAGTAISASDPRLSCSYGEFPLGSFDELLDIAMEYCSEPSQPMKVVDVGSGCGRLVMYASLSRGGVAVDGIEIAEELHSVATRIQEKGVSEGYFAPPCGDRPGSSVANLHLGTAEALSAVLEESDIIFAYSSAFRVGQDWNVELSAMVLGPEWSEMLANACRPGCIAITTDRALDPVHGWDLVERRDVDNPEVLGSTGFIHLLRK